MLRLIAALVFFSCAPAHAHQAHSGWEYPENCCTGKDCERVDSSRIEIVSGGYMLDDEFYIPAAGAEYTLVEQSGDSNFHACWSPIMVERQYGPRCFFHPSLTH